MKRFLVPLLTALLIVGVLSSSVAAQATPPFTATVLQHANLRGGPGTTFPIVGSASAGTTVQIATCNDDCTGINSIAVNGSLRSWSNLLLRCLQSRLRA